jgi:hypothetical protein
MPDADPLTDTAALRALEERIERAARAAERLFAEAADGVPARGWQRRGEEAPGPGPGPFAGWIDPAEARLLVGLFGELRGRIPPELERRILAALRELLLALRALLDWCVERAERRSGPPPEVQDIPIL